ncbi:MAG: hypothetical protein ACRD3J_16310, partial [Thermoanaerobaculia bacterium]
VSAYHRSAYPVDGAGGREASGSRVIFMRIPSTIHKNSREFTGMQERPLHTNGFRARVRMGVLIATFGLACTRSYPVGRLAVHVKDANDAPVGLVAADLYKVTPSGRVYWRATRTSSNGIAEFGGETGVIEGEYVVHIGLMPWQKLAPAEQNDRAVTLKAGDNTVVTFRVVPKAPVLPRPQSPA